MMRCLTHVAQRDPPYALVTCLTRFDWRWYSLGRRAGMPRSFDPQSPHFGREAVFFVYKMASLLAQFDV